MSEDIYIVIADEDPIEAIELVEKGDAGKSQYQSYLDTTTDDPVLTEEEWAAGGGTGGDGAPYPSATAPDPALHPVWLNTTNWQVYDWTGAEWVGGSVQSYTLNAVASSYRDALAAAGGAPTTAGIDRLSRAFDLLEAAGILDALVDGAYYGSDAQLAAGNPLSLMGTVAALTGAITREADGFHFDQSNAQHVVHPMASVISGTLAVDLSYNHAAAQTYHETIAIRSTDGTNKPILFYAANGGMLQMVAVNSNSATISDYVAQGTISRMVWMRNKDTHRVIANFGDGLGDVWVDGCPSTPAAPAWAYTSGVATTQVRVGGETGAYFKGTVTSWLAFSEVLDEAGAQAVNKALAIMDARSVNLLVEGD